ncbi:hypothetical protein GGS20DRAFT_540426 [Poronia punctata]|nr:hypothetical protein GGS20DRAFT_540426 [Poronia punctata]
MDQDHIDSLFERYLHLLHEYTSLREELTALQTGVYQDIARANFAAERGVRYGKDSYDGRMQALRRVVINVGDDEGQGQDEMVPNFAVVTPSSSPGGNSTAEKVKSEGNDETQQHPQKDEEADNTSSSNKHAQKQTATTTTTTTQPRDPLRWFGMLTPAPLRQAQTRSVRAVEEVIPRLASVNARMGALEIEIRRARKKRAKAEAQAQARQREQARASEIAAT